MDDLSAVLITCGVGSAIERVIFNYSLYADDICFMSLSRAVLQKLLNLCKIYCTSHDIIFSGDTKHVYKKGKIGFVDSVKYLGI